MKIAHKILKAILLSIEIITSILMIGSFAYGVMYLEFEYFIYTVAFLALLLITIRIEVYNDEKIEGNK